MAAAGVMWVQRRALLKVFIFPALFIIIILELIETIHLGIFSFLISLIYFFLFIPLVINVHRTVLLGESSVDGFGIHRWGNREKLFFIWSFGIVFLAFIIYLVPITILVNILPVDPMLSFPLTRILFYIPTAYIVSRLSIALPAIAVDLHPNFKWVMKVTRKDHWRIFFIVGLIPVIISYAINLFLSFHFIVFQVMRLLIWPFLAVFEIILLTLTYYELNRKY